jgi:hypothetical protein
MMHRGTYLEGWPAVQRIVLVCAQLGITDIGFQCFVVEMKFVVADDAISGTKLRQLSQWQDLEETITDRQPADQVAKGCQWQIKRFVGTEAHQGIVWKTRSTGDLPFVKISFLDELESNS